MLQYRKLRSFRRVQPLQYPSILILHISLNNPLHSLNLLNSIVQPSDLRHQLRSLRYQRSLNRLSHQVHPRMKSVWDRANPMQLSVIRPHDRAIVTDWLICILTEIRKFLLMIHADWSCRPHHSWHWLAHWKLADTILSLGRAFSGRLPSFLLGSFLWRHLN